MLSETDYAYLAGLIDGEGTISIYLNSRGYYITQVSITQVNEPLIRWLQEMFGGNVHNVKNNNPAKHQERWKWQITSTLMREHLPRALPYLRLKKRHAEIAIQFLSGRCRGGNPITDPDLPTQEELCEEIRELNRRGVQHVSV
jgi:hypothetical protein